MTDEEKSLETVRKAGKLLNETEQMLEQARVHDDFERIRDQLRQVQGLVELGEQHLYSLGERE